MILFPFTIETYRTVSHFIEHKPPDYRWPHLTDFWFTIVTTIVLGSMERAFEFFFYKWFY